MTVKAMTFDGTKFLNFTFDAHLRKDYIIRHLASKGFVPVSFYALNRKKVK